MPVLSFVNSLQPFICFLMVQVNYKKVDLSNKEKCIQLSRIYVCSPFWLLPLPVILITFYAHCLSDA